MHKRLRVSCKGLEDEYCMLQSPIRISLGAFRGYEPFLPCCHLCASFAEEGIKTAGPVGRELELFWFCAAPFSILGLWERGNLKSPVNAAASELVFSRVS